MFSTFLIVFVSAFLLNFFFVILGRRIRIFKARLPDGTTGVSKLGGVAIVFSFFIGVAFIINRFGLPDGRSIAFLTAAAFIFFLGILDDLLNFSPLGKLMVQSALSIFLVLKGIRTEIIFFPPFINICLSIFWFLVLMNAFNFLDILDGLAAGICVLTAATFLYIAHLTDNQTVGLFVAALLGSNLSFLCYNFKPAKLYMGDSGSLFNGLVLAMIAIMISYATAGREVVLFAPLLILALPLSDFFFVIFMRLKERKPITKKSRDHFVLRFIDQGITPQAAVFLMYFLNILFCIAALSLLSFSNKLGLFMLSFAVCIWVYIAYKIGWSQSPSSNDRK